MEGNFNIRLVGGLLLTVLLCYLERALLTDRPVLLRARARLICLHLKRIIEHLELGDEEIV